MALDFPTSPSPNQVYTAGAKSWSWDNTSGAWLAVNAGIQGTQGTQGALGTQGAQGLQGITGANGSNGSQGIQGIQGTEGTAGFVGSNGAQGTQGTQGSQGTQGTQGIQGLKGTKITPGDTAPASPSENDLWWDSTNGILMVYYNDGTSAQWVTANSGIAGEQGIQGTQGIQGIQGTQGTQGIQGLQGVQGTQGTQGVQGIQGITGLAFTIAKTYLSVAALTADTSPTAIVAGQFALINTTNVEDAENSRLYIWTGSAYTFVDDLSGSAGIQGITGSQGVQGIQGIQGIQGTQGTQGIQGTQGTQGLQGIQGISGASILGLNNTFTGVNSININGTVGATTANTVAATTISATGAITTSAGSITALAGEFQVGSSSKQLYLRTLSGSNRIDSYDNPITATVPLIINASTYTFQVADVSRGTLTSTGLNSTAIGATTPSTGAFSTLSATGQIQTPYGSFATQAIQVGDSSYGLYIDSGIFHFKNANGGTFNFRNAGNTGNTVSIDSTGLAVTGTLSATTTLQAKQSTTNPASTGALAGLSMGFDAGAEVSWIQSSRNSLSELRSLHLNPNGGPVLIGNGTAYAYGLTIKPAANDYTLTLLQSNVNNAGWGMWADTGGGFSLARYGSGVFSAACFTATLSGVISMTSNLGVTGTISAGSGAAVGGATAGAGGIAFPATAVAVANANTLDDYEEGTFTPNVYHTSSNNSTWSLKNGTYLKIGGKVTCWIICDSGNSGTTGSQLIISGIPFALTAPAGNAVMLGMWGANGPATRNGNVLTMSGALHVYTGGSGVSDQVTFFTACFTYQAS